MEVLRKVGRIFSSSGKKGEDGRDEWGSRLSFVLAAMGGAVGLGNLLRFPGQVFHNNGLQWFVPYLISLAMLGIPVLMLEISIGQGYRGGCVIAYHHINKRAKGLGLALVFTGYCVVVYYVPILAWVMNYFRNSFSSPLPWEGRSQDFYTNDVVANIAPIPGNFSADGSSVVDYAQYPGTGMVGETVGWCAFVWFVVWLCMFRGVGVLGRVVYITMGLPLVMAIILIGRGASLPNAGNGIKLYFGEWNSDQLARGDIYQAAMGQTFFSIGVGMGYFTSYASYNSKFSNAVQDSIIIACSNSLFEVLVAFAVFGVIGNLGLYPEQGVSLGTFEIAFVTYPEALAEMPGAQWWSFLFFFTVMLLGVSSSFALLESIVTLILDTDWGKKYPRWLVATVVTIVSFLLSLMYCTEFGFYLLDAADTWVNYLALFFVVWCECVFSTTIYRYKDVVSQVGWTAYLNYNGCFIGAQVFGIAVGHAVSPAAGAGLAFGLFIVGTIIAVLLSTTPDAKPTGFWGKNELLTKFWYLAFYSGLQLSRDLNVTVARGNNWKLPVFWAAILKYISAPILAIVFSFAYPSFHAVRNDPIHIFAFTAMHFVMVIIAFGFLLPRWFDIFVPQKRLATGDLDYAPNVTLSLEDVEVSEGLENGEAAAATKEKKGSGSEEANDEWIERRRSSERTLNETERNQNVGSSFK